MPWYSALLKHMIKQTVINNTKFAVSAILLFLVGYILEINLIVPACLLSLYLYLELRSPKLKNYRLLHLALLFVIHFVSSYLIIEHTGVMFFVPFCVIPMLATILFNELEISLVLTVACSISVASMLDSHFYLGVIFLISGIISSILVLGVRKRMAIIRAGFIIGLVQVVSLFLLDRFWIGLPFRYAVFMLNGVACGIIVLGVLPVFEYLFKTVTNISLLELADLHHPVLQRMILEAPGTYHHSLIVGNLADTACTIIGANSLLARIGAYYHDIGKLTKPEYFIENQDLKRNAHDDLSPTMSKLIIMNHVKEGLELAKKYSLSPILWDFIRQHHGNSLVYYFYRRALEGKEENQEITEEGFRYPGPKPTTKETAIVLLADSVEAATRTLKDPSAVKIEETVHKIINNKFIDGQLDDCELTLKDIERISNVFIKILCGIYHSRANYPQ